MELPPPHVLAQLDAIIVAGRQSVDNNQNVEDDEDGDTTVAYDSGDETAPYPGEGGARTASSRFWGVCWDRKAKKWQAQYTDADGIQRTIACFDDEEKAARAVNKAIRDAGLQGKRRMNPLDATGTLVPKSGHWKNLESIERAAAVSPDPWRATSSTFWGVTWHKGNRQWRAGYTDANGKFHTIGYFGDQEQAAHAVNAAIRRAGLEGRRQTNPVVNGRLVPKPPGRNVRNHDHKRRREEPATSDVPPPTRARRPRRAVDYAAMNDPGLEDEGDGSD